MPPDALHALPAHELAARIRRRECSAVDAARAYLDRIDSRNTALNAYLTVTRGEALARATEIDGRIADGKPVGALAGVPVALKDNLCTRGVRTTCSSRILENFVPPYDAHVVERLAAADAVFLGKTNLDEFAMGSSTENSAFGPTRNPWDPSKAPGGSSGGSAAAIAAGLAGAALGSDTGGSIRQPASLCGVVGLKPTYGRVSRYGLVAFASSLDQIGPITRDVRDAALLLQVMAGHDPRDSTSADLPVPDYLADLDKGVAGMTLGIPKEYFGPGLDPEVRASVEAAAARYRELGARTIDVSLPHTGYGIATYYVIAPSEASSNLARYDGVHYGHRTKRPGGLVEMYSRSREEGFGPEVTRRIILGTFALSSGYYDAYYVKALKVRRLVKRDFDEAFAKVDAILCPTSPVPAFGLGEKSGDPLALYLMDVLTVCCNLAGIPGISLPCGFTKAGLPIGLQLLGKPFDEAGLLRVARAFEGATEWHDRRAPG